MKCFYHNDMDGKCSAAIIRKYRNKFEPTEIAKYIGINYNIPFPFEVILPDEVIYIVDYSLPLDEFKKLYDITKNIIWIDHHKTAIEKVKDDLIISNLAGIRSVEKAGCELVWDYCFVGCHMPRAVQLIGDYDTWTYKYGNDTRYFQEAVKMLDTNPESKDWDLLLDQNYSCEDNMKNGIIALAWRDQYYKQLVDSWAFTATFEGYKSIVCNAACVGSNLFDSVKNIDDFDLLIVFIFDGSQWTISLYTLKDIDVSNIAKKYGGGGHPKASGFQTTEPFFTLFKDIKKYSR